MEQKEKMKAELEDLRIELHAQEEEERLKQVEIVNICVFGQLIHLLGQYSQPR